MRRRWRLRFGESPLGEWTRRHAQLQDPKRIRFAAKAPAQSGDAVQIARAAFLVVDLEPSGVVPRKYCGCECAHPLETIWRVCLSDGVLQYAQFLARGAHESAQDGSHGVLLAYSTPSQRVPCTPSGVWGGGQTMHTRRFRGYVHERAI